MIKGLLYDKKMRRYYIRDLEVSITNLCNLECQQCGFFVPNQRIPYIQDPIKEITEGLKILKDLNIYIHRFPILGGEPTINKILLEDAVESFKKVNNFDILEVVTNGLIPVGLTDDTLTLIDELTISLYFKSDELISLWRKWLELQAPHIRFSIRSHYWDRQNGNFTISDKKAQKMFENCWYRKHCTTIERKRIFVCSRIAKCGEDHEGLLLDNSISFKAIESFLNIEKYFPSCKRCVPLMGFPKIRSGIQPNNKLRKIIKQAIKQLNNKLNQMGVVN